MRRGYIASDKLQSQIDAYINNGIHPGDFVYIKGEYLKYSTSKDKSLEMRCRVKEVNDNIVTVFNGYNINDTLDVDIKVCRIDTLDVGPNPFPKKHWQENVYTYNYNLCNIIYKLFKEKAYTDTREDGSEYTVGTLNWNPYVFTKDNKKAYYQRGFVWSLENKQLLIDSIYNRINCGQILIRVRSSVWIENEAEKGEDIVYEFDVVDGKQRLNAIWEFINNKFPDSHGNYWNDLSERARIEFEASSALSYSEMGRATTDADVIDSFLSVNFAGVPVSKEHIEYVKQINQKL